MLKDIFSLFKEKVMWLLGIVFAGVVFSYKYKNEELEQKIKDLERDIQIQETDSLLKKEKIKDENKMNQEIAEEKIEQFNKKIDEMLPETDEKTKKQNNEKDKKDTVSTKEVKKIVITPNKDKKAKRKTDGKKIIITI